MDCELSELVNQHVNAALWDCCPSYFIEHVKYDGLTQIIEKAILEDAIAFAKKDPAARKNPHHIILGYTSFRAILHYRIANLIFKHSQCNADAESYSSIISSRGKFLSGAELHHRSSIGRRFVLDHGVGTVIGETSIIGDDCYVLGGVTLGAFGISDNPGGKRHPTIGARVQIGAYSRIFGNICIGDDVFIGPNCIITQDIPKKTKVTLKSNLQIHKDFCHHAVQLKEP